MIDHWLSWVGHTSARVFAGTGDTSATFIRCDLRSLNSPLPSKTWMRKREHKIQTQRVSVSAWCLSMWIVSVLLEPAPSHCLLDNPWRKKKGSLLLYYIGVKCRKWCLPWTQFFFSLICSICLIMYTWRALEDSNSAAGGAAAPRYLMVPLQTVLALRCSKHKWVNTRWGSGQL